MEEGKEVGATMKEAFDLIQKRLRNQFDTLDVDGDNDWNIATRQALSIVSEVEAEYGNGCEKQTYEIRLNGCDDDTTFKMDLTESEYQFLLSVSEFANKTSTCGCMPRLYVREYTPTTD